MTGLGVIMKNYISIIVQSEFVQNSEISWSDSTMAPHEGLGRVEGCWLADWWTARWIKLNAASVTFN